MINLILLLIYIVIDAIVDKKLIDQGVDVHNWRQYILRGFILGLLSWIFADPFLWTFTASCLIYWCVFDVTIARLLGKPFYYLSDKGIDGFMKNTFGVLGAFYFKALLAAASIIYLVKPELYLNQ